MRASCLPSSVVLTLTLALPVTGRAQNPVTFGIGGGASPTRETRSFPLTFAGGAHAQVFIERPRLLGRIGIRAEAYVHSFERPTFSAPQTGRDLMPGASLSLMLPLRAAEGRFQPYVLAGSGSYRSDVGQTFRDWHHGLSAGGGVEWRRARARPFIESRVINVYDGSSPRFVPVTVGLRF